MKQIIYLCVAVLTVYSCNIRQEQNGGTAALYTCPMPEDSVFSDKPGKCPKCGMQLVPAEKESVLYTCPMPEDSVFSDKPGKCPKCGMELVKAGEHTSGDPDLEALLRPTNEFVLSTIPVVALRQAEKDIAVPALGIIEYDTRQIGNIAANIAGRIEKLYVRYRFQKITRGQKIMDIYSPELMQAQENLLFLVRNDPSNQVMIGAAKQKLLLLGMSGGQLNAVLRKGRPDFAISVYSQYSGHIHEAGEPASMSREAAPMGAAGDAAPVTTMELSLKEGMYVQKGQTVFSVYNPAKSRVSLSIFPEDVALVAKGQPVTIAPEGAAGKEFAGTIDFIEPFFREGTKTLTARVYFDNSGMMLPIGSQVKARIATGKKQGNWLPQAAVVSLGLHKVVFRKVEGGFVAVKVSTGIENNGEVEIRSGLAPSDSVAVNAQYLTDSESFIRIKN